MTVAGGFGGATGYYVPTGNYTTKSNTVYQSPIPAPNTAYTVPPPPTTYQLPPPPPLPQLPQQTNTFLPQLQTLLSQYANVKPYQPLDAATQALLNTMHQGAISQFNAQSADAQDQLLARLFGNGVERSTIAGDAAGRLALQEAAARAGIESDFANQTLNAMQYGGQFGLNSLGQQAGIIGQGAGLEQNAYSQLVNALLGQGSLANQQYATQAGNTLNQQQLAQQYQSQQQQYALQQQQMLFQLLNQFGLGSGSLGLSGGSLGGGYTGGGGVGGGYQPPSYYQSVQNYLTPQQYQQQIMQFILSLLQRYSGGAGL